MRLRIGIPEAGEHGADTGLGSSLPPFFFFFLLQFLEFDGCAVDLGA